MSAEVLRRAATDLREEWTGGNEPMGTAWHRERDFHLAVAEWLDRVAGPVGIAQGNGLSGDAYDLDEALAVARAYLGESS